MPPIEVILVCILSLFVLAVVAPEGWADALTSSPAARLIGVVGGVIGFGVVMATAFQIWVDLADRRDERTHRREDAVSRAWMRLLAKAPGNTGKGSAFNFLIEHEPELGNIDLSCEMTGRWSTTENRCETAAIFEGVVITHPSSKDANSIRWLPHINWSGNHIYKAQIDRTHLERIGFSDAYVEESSVTRSFLNGDLSRATFVSTDLSQSLVSGSAEELRLRNVNVSNLAIVQTSKFSIEASRYLYAWADMPIRMPKRLQIRTFRREQSTMIDTSLLAIAPDKTLQRIKLCMPPEQAKGASSRPPLSYSSCERVSLKDAKASFPEVYTQ
ncbi:hypothetical protein [Nitratireductor rhodophyticola]|uniref:hypothetical protein n=1 Tax=Nitratireductor rhodophyticola TaxID=2854036 RepID=UPI0030097CA0